MQLWKLGCRWEAGFPLFYDFLVENNIVIGWVSKDYSIGDWILVTDGFTVLSFAEVTESRESVLNHTDWRQKFIDLKIPFDENIFIYKVRYIHLDNQIEFNYPVRQGIVKVQDQFYINLFNKLRKKYMSNQMMTNFIDLLKYKKQIILQGPPGTGKTKLARELAKSLTGLNEDVLNENSLSESDIISALKNVRKIRTVAGSVEYEILNVDEANKNIVLKKSTDTEASTTFSKVIELYRDKRWQTSVANNDDRRAAAIAGYIFENRSSFHKLEINDQIKIIQFHPSYSYEDFVRGIIAKPNQQEGGGVIYKVENKILAEFADTALKNFTQSHSSADIVLELQSEFKEQLEIFIEQINEAIDKDGYYAIGPDTTAKIVGLTDTSFIYSFDKRPDIRYQLLYSDLIKIDKHPVKVKRTLDVRDIAVGYLTMIGKHPYYFKIYNLIKSIQLDSPVDVRVDDSEMEVPRNYVLIIDEINRANLSSVLGELIYALEYRNEFVESMYAIDGVNKLTLPPNLYIIGTMNTADRSVGHIDYAIRRRFAFVDVMPERLQDSDDIYFNTAGYDQVAALFNKNNVSREFDIKDVQIGHSYFIAKKADVTQEQDQHAIFKMKMNYEVVPILLEYEKDGILVNTFNGKPIKEYIVESIKMP